jgi:hypothetical protein
MVSYLDLSALSCSPTPLQVVTCCHQCDSRSTEYNLSREVIPNYSWCIERKGNSTPLVLYSIETVGSIPGFQIVQNLPDNRGFVSPHIRGQVMIPEFLRSKWLARGYHKANGVKPVKDITPVKLRVRLDIQYF